MADRLGAAPNGPSVEQPLLSRLGLPRPPPISAVTITLSEHAMNWSDAMKENANRVSSDRVLANASDLAGTASTTWDPHDVWLTRVKQPRDRATSWALASALQRAETSRG